jgi:hypothetical protein
MNEQNVVKDEHHDKCACKCCCVRCISWSGIIIGALVAIGLGFLMNLFGVAIGLSAFKISNEGIKTLAIGGYIGLLIGSIAIMFFAGWVSGYLGRASCKNRDVGALYGFATWCVAFIFTVLLTAHIGQFTAHAGDALDYSSHAATNYQVYGTTNPDAPMVSQNNRNHADSRMPANSVVVNEEKVAHVLGLSLLLTFVLFFAGALAACFGGYCGISRCHTCRDKEIHNTNYK